MRYFIALILMYGAIIMASLSTFAADTKTETVILAGGCFWCLETDFKKLDGVTDAVSGYAGGDHPNPTYENYNKVSDEYKTPHIEVVKVTYDADKLSYKEILNYFYRHIDPTDGEGQFCDRGAGYRPAIFVKNKEQRALANQMNTEIAVILEQDVDVDIIDDAPFFPAEDYHQDYAEKNPVRYKFYRWNCGRDQRVDELWSNK